MATDQKKTAVTYFTKSDWIKIDDLFSKLPTGQDRPRKPPFMQSCLNLRILLPAISAFHELDFYIDDRGVVFG